MRALKIEQFLVTFTNFVKSRIALLIRGIRDAGVQCVLGRKEENVESEDLDESPIKRPQLCKTLN